MSLFQKVLSGLSKNINKQSSFKTELAQIISQELNIKIDPDNISVKNNNLFLDISPTIKSKVYLKKELLLNKLSSFNIKNIS